VFLRGVFVVKLWSIAWWIVVRGWSFARGGKISFFLNNSVENGR
jgi:hypothetical protein